MTEAAPAPAPRDRTQYQGRNLLLLLLALFGPAFVLFVKIACSIAASGDGVTPEQLSWLNRTGYFLLAVFFALEVISARYVRRLLRPVRTALGSAVQYAGVLLLCLFVSYCGAVSCEAFGYVVFLRVVR